MQLTEKGAEDAYQQVGSPSGFWTGSVSYPGQNEAEDLTPRRSSSPRRSLSHLRRQHLSARSAAGYQDSRERCPAEAASLGPTTTFLKVLNCLTKKCVAKEVRYMRHPLRISKS